MTARVLMTALLVWVTVTMLSCEVRIVVGVVTGREIMPV